MFTDNKVWVTVSYSINLGAYESLKVEAGASVTLLGGKSPLEMQDEMIDDFLTQVVRKAEIARDKIEDVKDNIER